MGSARPPSRGSVAQGAGLPLIPIVPILAFYGVDLSEGRWGNAMTACPIHNERHPSMSVNVEKGVFYCFACDAKGGALSFIMAMDCVGRSEALEKAEKILKAAGQEIKKRESSGRYQRPGSEGAVSAPGRRYVPPGRR